MQQDTELVQVVWEDDGPAHFECGELGVFLKIPSGYAVVLMYRWD